MNCCPHCHGTEGYQFRLHETHVYHGDWATGAEEAVDTVGIPTETIPTCMQCGKRVPEAQNKDGGK